MRSRASTFRQHSLFVRASQIQHYDQVVENLEDSEASSHTHPVSERKCVSHGICVCVCVCARARARVCVRMRVRSMYVRSIYVCVRSPPAALCHHEEEEEEGEEGGRRKRGGGKGGGGGGGREEEE